MVTCLSAVPSLESLRLIFRSPRPHPDWTNRRPPPLTRAVLPALTEFYFRGVSEYLEDLISQVDAPLMRDVNITFFLQLTFDMSQLHQFISRTGKLGELNKVDVQFLSNFAIVTVSQRTETFDRSRLRLSISCSNLEWQLSSLVEVCGSSLPSFSTLEDLKVWEEHLRHESEEGVMVEDTQWLELFHPFSAAKNLSLSKELVPRVVPALNELAGESATEVLPALQSLDLEGPQPSEAVQDAIGQFNAIRWLSYRPVTVKN